jgi:pimeloyl-ACP methyl ester carboxylesterase
MTARDAGGYSVKLVKGPKDAPWVVMLPGAGATIAVWFAQVRAFAEHFNLALVDLPGHHRRHGAPPTSEPAEPYAFDRLVMQLELALDEAGIGRCHVVALSLGTILARVWARRNPARLESAVLAGTIADLTPLPRVLMRCGWYLRRVLPYMMLYRLYAWIIMPGPSHRTTRRLFHRDARSLGQAEFNRWFDLSSQVADLLAGLRGARMEVPTLHVMGSRDYMFLDPCIRVATDEGSAVTVIPGVGHVCSVEAADQFNEAALAFLTRRAV